MKKGARCLVLSVLLATLISPNASSQTADPAIGVWKLNLAKSKYNPGPPQTQMETRTIEDRGGGVILMTAERISLNGERTIIQYVAKYDGKAYPKMVLGAKTLSSISLKAIDLYTVEGTEKEDGKVTARYTRTVSKDGNTMTQSMESMNAQGQKIRRIMVFDRQ
jgi:hypothetical protein